MKKLFDAIQGKHHPLHVIKMVSSFLGFVTTFLRYEYFISTNYQPIVNVLRRFDGFVGRRQFFWGGGEYMLH